MEFGFLPPTMAQITPGEKSKWLKEGRLGLRANFGSTGQPEHVSRAALGSPRGEGRHRPCTGFPEDCWEPAWGRR